MGVSVAASTSRFRARTGLRPRPTTESGPSFVADPDLLLRKPRRKRQEKKQEQAHDLAASPTRCQLDTIMQSIEKGDAEDNRPVEYWDSGQYFYEETPPLSGDSDLDPGNTFNQRWGYLPPFDAEVAAVIDAIVAHPEMAKEFQRVGAADNAFCRGLLPRNVMLGESSNVDPYVDHITRFPPVVSVLETSDERQSHDQLWILDQAKCNGPSNEALFKRTFMMNLISRLTLIYDRGTSNQSCLDFSVEEPWTCPPMPTNAYYQNISFLTCPEPDLAVCFRAKALIHNDFWSRMPEATRRLAYYENPSETGLTKICVGNYHRGITQRAIFALIYHQKKAEPYFRPAELPTYPSHSMNFISSPSTSTLSHTPSPAPSSRSLTLPPFLPTSAPSDTRLQPAGSAPRQSAALPASQTPGSSTPCRIACRSYSDPSSATPTNRRKSPAWLPWRGRRRRRRRRARRASRPRPRGRA